MKYVIIVFLFNYSFLIAKDFDIVLSKSYDSVLSVKEYTEVDVYFILFLKDLESSIDLIEVSKRNKLKELQVKITGTKILSRIIGMNDFLVKNKKYNNKINKETINVFLENLIHYLARNRTILKKETKIIKKSFPEIMTFYNDNNLDKTNLIKLFSMYNLVK